MIVEKLKLKPREVDPQFVARILKPYQPTGTDYLKSAGVIYDGLEDQGPENTPIFTMAGHFSIPNSCYIKDTGHFNAVEFLICFNQLAYTTFGHLINSKAFHNDDAVRISPICLEAVSKVSIDRFFEKQLSSMLILKAATRFKSMINAKSFFAELSVKKLSLRRGTVFTETSCVFRDEDNGYADGEVLLAYPMNSTH